MDIGLYIVALLMAVIGLLGTIIPILPGTLLSLAAVVVLYFSSSSPISGVELLVWGVACVVATVMDAFLPAVVVRKMGGSKYGAVGSTIGVVVGLLAFPPLGVVMCPFFGAVMGEWVADKSDIGRAFKVGFGSFVAFLVGTGVKFLMSLWIFGVVMMLCWGELSAWIGECYERLCFLIG